MRLTSTVPSLGGIGCMELFSQHCRQRQSSSCMRESGCVREDGLYRVRRSWMQLPTETLRDESCMSPVASRRIRKGNNAESICCVSIELLASRCGSVVQRVGGQSFRYTFHSGLLADYIYLTGDPYGYSYLADYLFLSRSKIWWQNGHLRPDKRWQMPPVSLSFSPTILRNTM